MPFDMIYRSFVFCPLKKIAFFCASFAVIFPLTSSSYAETLEEAVLYALNFHPVVESAVADKNAAGQSYKEQRAGYYPELSVSAGAGRVYGDNSTSRGLTVDRGDGYSWLGEGNVTVTQMLFDGFKTSSGVDSAEAKLNEAKNLIMSIREDLASRATVAYLDLIKLQEQRPVIDEFYGKFSDYVDRIKSMVTEGAAGEADLHRAEDIFLALKDIKTENSDAWAKTSATYAEITGTYPKGGLVSPVHALPEISSVEDAVEIAVHGNPSLNVMYDRAMSSKENIDMEKSALYPELDAQFSYYKKDIDDLIGGEVVDAKGMLQLNWALSLGGRELDRIKRSKYEYVAAKTRINEIRRNIERDVRIAYKELETSAEMYSNQSAKYEIATKMNETANAQFEGGGFSLLQLMQVENQLFDAKMQMINSRYRMKQAKYDLLARMGILQKTIGIISADAGSGNNAISGPKKITTKTQEIFENEE